MSDRNHVHADVIIVGSGPAGVSAAFPLLDAGLRVLMVDGGKVPALAPPAGQFLDLRRQDLNQWRWMIGPDFHALQQFDAVSPKLRVPTHATVFEGFLESNRIVADDFVAIGSLAPGGLSNAWGCGVACLTKAELDGFPVTPEEMRASYAAVAKRIGVSGGSNDDLSDFFGLDPWSQTSVPIDELQGCMLERYMRCREALHRKGFRLGRARVAALTDPLGERQACRQSGNCLWGCDQRALYSATSDLQQLSRYSTFHYRPGFVVRRVVREEGCIVVEGSDEVLRASRVLLAAGTLASTRLALQAIGYRQSVAMQACPTAAFMLWLPRYLGRAHSEAFGLGQLSFTLKLAGDNSGFGSLFNTTGIPVTEFARHIPFGRRYGLDLLKSLLTSCVVGNLFLPGTLTDVTLRLDANNALIVKGAYRDEVTPLMHEAHRLLGSGFRKLGAMLMPTSFKIGRPGADIHYAASLPMREVPQEGQTNRYGELAGAPGIFVVDGASLSSLPAKSHTLTIMANADRISSYLAMTLAGCPAS